MLAILNCLIKQLAMPMIDIKIRHNNNLGSSSFVGAGNQGHDAMNVNP